MAINLVLGLGNPGFEYARTRHNAGFQVVEVLLWRHDSAEWIDRPLCEVAAIAVGGFVGLARPMTFMNRSGDAALWLLDEFEISPQQMLVVVDDIDLPLGGLRLRRSGGPGTHNGLRDLCAKIGEDFPRLRVGMRGEEIPEDLADYVTSPYTAAEVAIADAAIERAADAVEMALREGFERAMNVYNRPPSTDESRVKS
jgi:PTH1 family peptidyl-tRNA hydrolase